MARDILERFFEKIEFVPIAGCWIWSGAICKQYGHFNIGRGNMLVHRFSWEIHNAIEIPYGMHVLHRCDVPCCINPAHLFLGTHADNMRDMKLKGRAKSGNPGTTFSKEQVAFMVRERERGVTCVDLGDRLGVAHCTISNLSRRAGFPYSKRRRFRRL